MNIDDFLAARFNGFADKENQAFVLQFFQKVGRMIGVKYEYTIDSKRLDNVVCSSFVQRVYSGNLFYLDVKNKLDFPQYYFSLVGRDTYELLPDSTFSELFRPQSKFTPVAFILNAEVKGMGLQDKEKMMPILTEMFNDFWSVSPDRRYLHEKPKKEPKKKWKIAGPEWKEVFKRMFRGKDPRAAAFLNEKEVETVDESN